MMKNKAKNLRLSIEAVILIGLAVKLALSLNFLMIMDDWTAANAFGPPLAHAQEQAEPAEPESTETEPPAQAAPSDQQESKLASMTSAADKERFLRAWEERLDQREQALDALEKQVQQRMDEITATRKKLEELVKKQQALVEKEETIKDARIEHLVTAYKAMRPENAANLVNELDDAVAVRILAAMPGRSAGLILANVNPEKAARLTRDISMRRAEQNQAAGTQ
jgi:flagellar motility protein MotE (MotC chaperone)